jgi:hypothetical protein
LSPSLSPSASSSASPSVSPSVTEYEDVYTPQGTTYCAGKYTPVGNTYTETYVTMATEYCRGKYVVSGYLKMEDDGYLLQETGKKIVLDTTPVTTIYSDEHAPQGTTYTDKYHWYI